MNMPFLNQNALKAIAMRSKPKRKYPESELATALVKWFDYSHRGLGVPSKDLLIHCKNEGKQSPIAGARMRAQGVRPGVSDYLLLVPRGAWHGLALEVKAPTGKLSDAQRAWLDLVCGQGYFIAIAYSLDEAMVYITRYLRS